MVQGFNSEGEGPLSTSMVATTLEDGKRSNKIEIIHYPKTLFPSQSPAVHLWTFVVAAAPSTLFSFSGQSRIESTEMGSLGDTWSGITRGHCGMVSEDMIRLRICSISIN